MDEQLDVSSVAQEEPQASTEAMDVDATVDSVVSDLEAVLNESPFVEGAVDAPADAAIQELLDDAGPDVLTTQEPPIQDSLSEQIADEIPEDPVVIPAADGVAEVPELPVEIPDNVDGEAPAAEPTPAEEVKEPEVSPHAMEIHDFPEDNESGEPMDQDDPDKTMEPAEKSMETTLINSSAIDPFDAVKNTTAEAAETSNQDSTMNETAVSDTVNETVNETQIEEESNQDAVEVQDSEPEQTNESTREGTPTRDASPERDDGPNEGDVEEISDGENEDLQILADCEREISEADKEKARLESEKEAQEAAETTTAPEPDDDDDIAEVEAEEVDLDTAAPVVDLSEDVSNIYFILDTVQACHQCNVKKCCRYRMRENDVVSYFCEDDCVTAFIGDNTAKYTIKRKKYMAEADTTQTTVACYQCDEEKVCQYSIQQDDEKLFLCEDACLNLLLSEQPDRVKLKQAILRVRNLPQEPPQVPTDKFTARTEEEMAAIALEREQTFIRTCSQCCEPIGAGTKALYWETMTFCNEQCLGFYQNMIGSCCTSCTQPVPNQAMGKYCVRFGFEVRQFCRSGCLDQFKKSLKCCAYCQNDIGLDESSILAPVGEKKTLKDFCTTQCKRKYEDIVTPSQSRKLITIECDVCNARKPSKIQLLLDGKEFFFCKSPCFSAFKFVNNVSPDECTMCNKHFERRSDTNFTVYKNPRDPVMFCSKICQNIYITVSRLIVQCNWCKVKKYNFDMIVRNVNNQSMCSLSCLQLHDLSQQATTMKRIKCDQCRLQKQPQYHLTMSDTSIRNFCTYQCVMSFQNRYNKQPLTLDSVEANSPVPTGLPKRIKKHAKGVTTSPGPMIAAVHSLAPSGAVTYNGTSNSMRELRITLQPLQPAQVQRNRVASPFRPNFTMPPSPPSPTLEKRTNLILIPAPEAQITNKVTQVKPIQETKAVSCRPAQCSVEIQTCRRLERKRTIPIPVPIYVPTPAAMYVDEIPIPVPIPIPIPIPIFVPTSRNSASGILKEIKKIHDKMPSDPYEAELLMMADMVAGGKKDDDSESSEEEDNTTNMYQNQTGFNEDLVQMALKMASNEYDDHVDLESAMQANTITHQQQQATHGYDDVNMLQQQQLLMMHQEQQRMASGRGRKRGSTNKTPPGRQSVAPPNKRVKREVEEVVHPEPPREPEIKPDANMCLKYTFGVNAWKQWVLTKNTEIEKSATKRRPFKSEILQMTADELNYSLCLFVKEVRKPNGSEYAPDTIYYLVLGIQQYLYENGRIDNIFTDPYYDRFTECLDEVARKFSVLYNDSQYIVTRVEEEHLWECKQLGAHSPHVLLSTLMFFNTKHFNLTSVEEHSDLSFSHIMKHWKRGPGQTGHKGHQNLPGQRNVLLRYYPPQATLNANVRKKKVYEQSENEENPLRCPVKLYEFYLSKCPESVKTRNDVFYLQPERSCVPDSPVWYSTQAMHRDGISKMLHRVKMVKEINIALLTS